MTYSRLLSRTLPCVLATSALLAACSRADFDPDPDAGGDPPDAGGFVSDGSPDDGPASDGGSAVPILCDGTTSIRLAYVMGGGGQIEPASRVLSENGYRYLLVSGTCHYWVMEDVRADVREGDLSAEAAASLSTALRLGAWSTAEKEARPPSCSDGPSESLRFGDERVRVPPQCTSPTSAVPAAWLATILPATLDGLYGGGRPVSGNARFVLMKDSAGWSPLTADNAAQWPLATTAVTVARSREQANAYEPGDADVASGDDAVMLKTLRRDLFAKSGFQYTGGFIPVVDDDGLRYQLFVRDDIPVEDERGLLPVF
jgi:hypothetical protein